MSDWAYICHVSYLEDRKYPYLYICNDFNHVTQPCCVLFCGNNATEILKHNCFIKSLWLVQWIQKKTAGWLLTAGHVATCFPEFVIYFVDFIFQLSISTGKLLLLLETMTVTRIMAFWLYIIVNACLKQCGFLLSLPGASNGLSSSLSWRTSECAPAALPILSCGLC